MEIMMSSLKERMRRKDLYIMIALGILAAMFCLSDSGTISIDGVPITESRNLLRIVSNVIAVIGGGIAIAVSLNTIPREYELRTSQLIWIRGVSQRKYHGHLALANVVSSLFGLFVMYAASVILTALKGEEGLMIKMVPAFLFYAVGTAGISLLTSALSLIFPTFLAGILSVAVMLAGTMYPLLEAAAGILSGVSGGLLKGALKILPDLYSVNSQGINYLLGEDVSLHKTVIGLLFCWIFAVIICIYRRREA